MKIHTTNYKNTFIEIAEDSPTLIGENPPNKGDKKTIANLEFDLLNQNPYKYNSDEIIFSVFATRKEIDKKELENEKQKFFSKGQPCFRASALTKKYGWGIHYDQNEKMAIYGAETEMYQEFLADDSIKKVKAMRSKK